MIAAIAEYGYRSGGELRRTESLSSYNSIGNQIFIAIERGTLNRRLICGKLPMGGVVGDGGGKKEEDQ